MVWTCRQCGGGPKVWTGAAARPGRAHQAPPVRDRCDRAGVLRGGYCCIPFGGRSARDGVGTGSGWSCGATLAPSLAAPGGGEGGVGGGGGDGEGTAKDGEGMAKMALGNLRVLLDGLAAGPACLVTVASTRGSAPREPGAWMAVFADRLVGSIGGGHLEWQAITEARRRLAHGVDAGPMRCGLRPPFGEMRGGRGASSA